MAADRSPGDFGSKLREARERRGISLRQIANATKISVVALEALERNDLKRLPGGLFSRAFVRAYALEVGLDPEQTTLEFLAQFPHDSVTAGHPQAAAQVEDHQAHESDRRTATTFVRLLAVSIPLAGAVLYFSMRRTPPALSPEPAAMASTAPAPSVVPSSASVAAGADVGSATPLAAVPPGDSAAEAAAPAAAADDVLTVGLLASRECWVSATADGARVIERLMHTGERASVEVRRELVLNVGDAGALSMTLNGADAKPLGGSGQVVTTRLTLSNFKGYLSGR